MKKTKPMIIWGIVLLALSFGLTIFSIFKFAGFIQTAINMDFDSDETVLIKDILIFYATIIPQVFGYMGGLFLVIFGAIRGKKIDRNEARRQEERAEVSFTDAKEFAEQRCSLADVKIVNTNQLNINDKIINMSDISKLHMDRNEIRFKTNNEEYIISYQNSSEAVYLVGRIKQYCK